MVCISSHQEKTSRCFSGGVIPSVDYIEPQWESITCCEEYEQGGASHQQRVANIQRARTGLVWVKIVWAECFQFNLVCVVYPWSHFPLIRYYVKNISTLSQAGRRGRVPTSPEGGAASCNQAPIAVATPFHKKHRHRRNVTSHHSLSHLSLVHFNFHHKQTSITRWLSSLDNYH